MRNEKSQNELIGALIGLAKACESNPMTEEGTRLIIRGLRMVCSPTPFNEEAYKEMVEAVHKEKYQIVPNCATCNSPCGNTSDYNMELMWKADQTVRQAKERLLSALEQYAEDVFLICQVEKRVPFTEEVIFKFYQGLAVVSFDYSPEEIDQVTEEIHLKYETEN